ncbi:MAG: nitrate reductase [Desulfurella sp.]|uniref:respiratory nitrate reductase subunit gamma n=1 Tax=Desulfurella sp. TaxID=1962857 RepID=UPI000CAAAE0F|nr:respiratory nitrate reductase subunit gamma [Desulfurella sp.]PMP87767.1 MAG: nitrate reductase [Desulfurella sp.]
MDNLDFVSFMYVILTYAAFAILIIGVVWKIIVYAKTPMPVKIPLTPAPKTKTGAFFRVLGEVFFFKSLYRSNKSTWVGGYVFHVSLAIVLIQHVLRHYVYDFYHGNPPAWYNLLVPIGLVFGTLILISLVYLFLRRIFVERVKFISVLSDYFILVLLMLITIAGLSEIVFQSPAALEKSVVQLDAFFNKLFIFQPFDIPHNPFFLLHYTLVLILLAYIPFSKIMHFVGIFFSPTLAMNDDVRENRYTDERTTRLTI